MTGILIKDIYNVRKQIFWYLGMTVVFFVLSVALKNTAFVATISMMVTVSVPMTAIAYEERESWQKFLVASGTDKKVIVLEKYLLGLASGAFCLIMYLIAFLIVREEGNVWNEYVISVAMCLIALSASLPLIFKFGVEKGRTMIVAIVVVLMAVWLGVLYVFDKRANMPESLMIAVSLITAAVVLAVSYFFSVKIYGRKEF